MDPMVYAYLARVKAKEMTSPLKETEPMFSLRPSWKKQLASYLYGLASSLDPKSQDMKLNPQLRSSRY